MSKVLEDFKIVKFKTINAGYDYGYKVWDEIEQELIKVEELKDKNKFLEACNKDWEDDYEHLKYSYEIVRKQLEIIFYKNVNTMFLVFAKTYKEYNDRLLSIDPNLPTEVYFLTEEEFDILKK